MTRNLRKIFLFTACGLGGIGIGILIFLGTSLFQAKNSLESFLEESPQKGIPLVYEKVEIHSFFPSLCLKIKKLGIDGWYGIEGDTQEVFVKYSLLDSHKLIIEAPLAVVKYLDYDVSLSNLKIHIDPFAYTTAEAKISFEHASLKEKESVKGTLEKGILSFSPQIIETHNDQGIYKIPSLQVELVGQEIRLGVDVEALGGEIKNISLKGLIQESSSLLKENAISFWENLEEWRKNGGVIDLEKVSFRWGPIEGEMEGALALDSAFYPEGAFTVRLTGIPTFLRDLVKSKKIPPEQQVVMQMALGFLDASSHDFVLPVTIQNKRVNIGNFMKISLEKEFPTRTF